MTGPGVPRERYAESLSGGFVILHPAGTRRVLGLVRRGIAATSRADSIAPGPDMAEVLRELETAVAEAPLLRLPVPLRPQPTEDPIGTAEAAALLDCGQRNVVDLIRRGRLQTARRMRGRRWALDRAEVLQLVSGVRRAAQSQIVS